LFFSDSQPKPFPHAVIEKNNTVIYKHERYAGKMFFDVARYKGSTGAVKLIWGVTFEPNTPPSFIVTPQSGEVEFSEGQWNSSIHLQFPFIPVTDRGIGILVKLLHVSDGAILGNFISVKITFPPNVTESEETIPEDNSHETKIRLTIVFSCSGGVLIIGIIIVIVQKCQKG
jgi:hypothetical protein